MSSAQRAESRHAVPYVLVAGAGKSGTKRVLKLFDLSPATHVRCEPNELEGSPFLRLPDYQVPETDAAEQLERGWDAAVEWASVRMGERDRFPKTVKHHIRSRARTLGLHRVVRHGKLRRVAGLVLPSLRGAEWAYPAWLGDRERLREATPVLKIGPAAGWVPWVLENRSRARVVAVIRHPGGFVYSHRKRWLDFQDQQQVARANRERLRRVLALRPGWSLPSAEVDAMSAVETELWFWRYVYEALDRAGRATGRYLRVRDEDVVADPVPTARRLWSFSGVEPAEDAEAYLRRMTDHWREHTAPWRSLLDTSDEHLVDKVLEGSALASLWEADQRVSLPTYRAYE